MEEHWLLRRFIALPWYVKGPAIPGGFLVSASYSQFPPNLQLLGYYCGLALALWVILASIWHWTNDWHLRNSRLCFVLGVGIFIIAGWHLLEEPPALPPSTTVSAPPSVPAPAPLPAPAPTTSSDPKKTLEEIAELENYVTTMHSSVESANKLAAKESVETWIIDDAMASAEEIIRLRDRSISASNWISQIYSKYRNDEISHAVQSPPMIAGQCNQYYSLISRLRKPIDLQRDVYSEPAYQAFAEAAAAMVAWQNNAQYKLKEFRFRYEEAQNNVK
jgi:hypothetical protein